MLATWCEQSRSGRTLPAIPYGANWADEIERAIAQTTFYIPIVTPRFLKSQTLPRRIHVVSAANASRSAANDLIFPVHYVDVDDIRAGGYDFRRRSYRAAMLAMDRLSPASSTPSRIRRAFGDGRAVLPRASSSRCGGRRRQARIRNGQRDMAPPLRLRQNPSLLSPRFRCLRGTLSKCRRGRPSVFDHRLATGQVAHRAGAC